MFYSVHQNVVYYWGGNKNVRKNKQKQIWKISQDGTGNDYLQRETFDQKVITIGYPIEGKEGDEPQDENRKQVLQFKNDIKVGIME